MTNPESYSRVTLPQIDPIISSKRLDEIFDGSSRSLFFWAPYNEGSHELQELHRSVLTMNIENSLKHSAVTEIGNSDIRSTVQGPRPHAALYHGDIGGFGGVEIIAALPSTDDEPHNAMTRVPLERGIALMGSDWEHVADKARSRIKVTRYYPKDEPVYAVVSTKIDQHGVRDPESGTSFGVKSRRSGYVVLDDLDSTVNSALDTLINMQEHEPTKDPIVEMARRATLEYLDDSTTSYQAVVDRIYATK